MKNGETGLRGKRKQEDVVGEINSVQNGMNQMCQFMEDRNWDLLCDEEKVQNKRREYLDNSSR